MKFFKKRTLSFSVIICLLFTLQASNIIFAEKADKKNFKIDFNYGFNKFYMSNSEVLAKIKVTNNFEDIEGKVQLLLDSDQSEDKEVYRAYSEDLYLSKNSTKTIDIKFFVGQEDALTLRILDENDKILWEKTFRLEKAQEPNSIEVSNTNMSDVHKNNIYIGILSDSFDNLTYLNRIPLSQSEENSIINKDNSYTLVANLDGMFPEDKSLLKTLGIIIINDYNTENLNKNQLNALKEWIKDGGNLVIGTGTNHQKTLTGLKGLVGEFDSGSKSLSEENFTVLHNKVLDKGNITILSFDVGMSSFLEWQGNRDFIIDLISKYVPLGNYTNQDESYETINNIVETIPVEKEPQIKTMRLVFILLIFLVLIIIYLVLKKLNKKEKMWISIPVISLMFIIFMYIFGSGSGLKNTLLNSISITQLSKDSDFGTTKSTVGIVGAKGNSVEVIADKERYIDANGLDRNTNYKKYKDGEIILESTLGIGKESKVRFKNDSNDNSKVLNLEEKVKLDIKTDDIHTDPEKIIGKINNNSNINLEDVVLLYGNSYYRIGNLQQKEIKDINIKLEDLKTFIFGKDIVPQMYPIYSEASDNKYIDILDNSIKSNILNNGLKDYSKSNKVNLTLIAWSRDSLIKDLKINDSRTDRIDRNLIFIPLVDYISGRNIDIPFGVIKPEVLEYPGLNIATYKPKRFSGNGHIVYSIKPNSVLNINDLSIQELNISLQSDVSTGDIKAYIYNYTTSDWDFQNVDKIIIDENSENIYYDESRGVQIKLQPTNRNVLIQEPVFSMKGTVN